MNVLTLGSRVIGPSRRSSARWPSWRDVQRRIRHRAASTRSSRSSERCSGAAHGARGSAIRLPGADRRRSTSCRARPRSAGRSGCSTATRRSGRTTRTWREHRDRLGWLDAPAHFAQNTAALEGFGDGVVEAGFDTRGRRWAWAAPASRRTSSTAHSARPRATSGCASSTRLTRRPWRQPSTTSTRSRRSGSSPASRARPRSRMAFLADAWARVEARARGAP